jgi:hypothetical protein
MADLKETAMNTSTNTRIVALALAAVATLSTLHSIDVLASRERGESLMSRTAVQAVTVANSLRGAKRS